MSFLEPFNFSDFGNSPFGTSSSYHHSLPFGSFGGHRFSANKAPLQQYHQTLHQSIDTLSGYKDGGSGTTGFYDHSSSPQILTGYQPQPRRQLGATKSHSRRRRPKKVKQHRNVYKSGVTEVTRVTPIQGPIYAKDGFVPVVPLYSYPAVNNGTLYQIPDQNRAV